ncbi:isoprenyl synthetase [Bacteroidia bacterium]|nr:isoprenyl synthetase [Bacteroidia bacterium]
MYALDQLKALLKEELAKQEYVETPYSLYAPIVYILADGGKLIRPMLALIAYNIYRDDIEKVLKPAIGIEIFHNYTLLHDDIMDDAELRRGKPTVHRKWNINVAILSGDAAAITAYKYIGYCDDIYFRRAIDFFNQVAMDVCKGQQFDMEFETRNDVTEAEYLHMISMKTAALLAGGLRHGALIAGAPEDDYTALYEFGLALGMMFQLQDDYLDVYGDTEVFGKKIGGDILENKKTFLLIKALELANPTEKKELEEWLSRKCDKDDKGGKGSESQDKIKAVTEIYTAIGIPALVQAKIDLYVVEAKKACEKINVPPERKRYLYEMMDFIDKREK